MKKERTSLRISELEPNTGQIEWLPKNPRQWTQDDIDRTAKSIAEDYDFLEDRPLLAVPHDGRFVVFAGNLRMTAARQGKVDSVPVIVYTVEDAADQQTILRRAMKDNGSFGAWDWDALANEWDELPLGDWGVPAWPSAEDDGESSSEKHTQEDDFDEEKDQIEVRCKRGDIWHLGEHRLMCGDSTDAASVALLMDGERADIAFTSPPYGVIDGSLRKHQEKGNPDKSASNFYKEYEDNQEKWPSLIEESWQRMQEYTDQQFINIQMLADNKRALVDWVARHSNKICDILIWDKGNAAPQMASNVVNNNYEFIFVFGEEGSTRAIKYGGFHGDKNAIIRIGTGINEYADIHKAVFPVALASEILQLNKDAYSVVDLFGGTGTTIIAAEQLGRKCYMMEIDPHYCDVIIARWEKMTGDTAEKLN